MTPSEVDSMLKGYRFEVGRCNYLQAKIGLLEHEIERAKHEMVGELVGPVAQVITDMPRGTTVGNPTEKYGTMLADGWMTDEVRDKLVLLNALREEYKQRHETVDYVESWLSGLPERERWIVEMQVIDAVIWREIIAKYPQLFGEYRSKDTLKRMRNKALDTIYDMAQ